MALFSRRKMLEKMAGAVALAAMPRDASADAYPSRPIRLVIPYAAGGSGDQIGRPWANRMTSLLGPAYVENIGGAGGALGCLAVAQGAADGHSLLLGNGSTQVIFPLTSAQPAYDTIRDFRAIYRLITSTLAFAVHPSLPVNNLQALIAYARANPGKLSYGSPGVGTGNHLVGEMMDHLQKVTHFGPGGRPRGYQITSPVHEEPLWDNPFLHGLRSRRVTSIRTNHK